MATPISPNSKTPNSVTPIIASKATILATPAPVMHTAVIPVLPKDPKKELRKGALVFLFNEKSQLSPINWRQFAFMNNTSFIKNTAFDNGGLVRECTASYLEYLTSLEKRGCFFTSNLHPKMLTELKCILNDLEAMRSTYPQAIFGVMPEVNLSSASAKVLMAILQQLVKNGVCYFSIGYSARKGEGSHAIICKVSRGLKNTTVTFLNLGAGVSRHPDLDVCSTHYKTSFAYYPVVVPNSEWVDQSSLFLHHLLRFITDTPPEKCAKYSMGEIYDLLHLLGPLKPGLITAQSDQLRGKVQHVGDCPEKAVRNVLIDYLLVEKRAHADDVMLLFLNLHFVSLISAYWSYKGKPDSQTRELLRNGCQEFGVALLRAKDKLKAQEFLSAAEIIDVMLEETNTCPPASSSLQLSTPLLKSFLVKTHPEIVEQRILVSGYETSPCFFFRFRPLHFKNDFKEWLASLILASDVSQTSFHFFAQCPIPKWNDPNDPWNQVPASDIQECLAEFQRLVDNYDPYHGKQTSARLVFLTMYAIVDKLSRRIPTITKLEGFVAAPLRDIEYDEGAPFIDAFSSSRYLEIRSYFKSQQGRIMARATDCAKAIQDKKASVSTNAVNCLLYLDQFKPNMATANDYEQLQLPKEVKLFIWFAFNKHVKDPMIGFNSRNVEDPWFETQAKTSNELFFFKKPKDSSKALVHFESYKITRHRNLKIGEALQWIQKNWNALDSFEVQSLLTSCFFSCGVLLETLSENRAIVKEFRDMIDQGLLFFSEEKDKISEILFLIKIGVTFETFASEFLQESIPQERLKTFKILLHKMLVKFDADESKKDEMEIRIRLALIQVDAYMKFDAEEGWINCYGNIFTYKTKMARGQQNEELYFSTNYLLLQTYQNFNSFLAVKGNNAGRAIELVATGLIKQLVPGAPICKWTYKNGLATCDHCKLYFMTGDVRHPKFGCRLIRFTTEEKKLWSPLGFKESEAYWHPSTYMTYDGSIIFSIENGKPIVRSLKNGDTSLFPKFTNELYNNLYFLSKFQQWSFVNASKILGQKQTVLLASRDYKPYALVDFFGDSVTIASITRVNEAQNKLPWKLANLEKLSPTHPHYASTLQFAPHDEILCFVHETTDVIQELEFLYLELKFKRNATGLESIEFPGYFLISLPIKELEESSKAAIVLRGPQGKIKVIIPIPRTESRALGKSETEEGELAKFRKSFVFDLSGVDAPFAPKSFSEKLFLIFFYKSQGNVAKALSELQKIGKTETFDEWTFSILNLFFNLTDASPESLSFNMKLVLFVIERYSQTKTIDQWFLYSSQTWYLDYLRCLGDDQIGGIPKRLRLREEEEARILSTYVEEKIPMHKIFSNREILFHTNSRSVAVDFFPDEIELAPEIFARIAKPEDLQGLLLLGKPESLIPYPNRITPNSLEYNFSELYAKAKRAIPGKNGPFDYELLAILRVEWSNPGHNGDYSNSEKLAAALFYVRHFPDLFANVPCQLPAIEAVLKTLNKHPKYEAFIANVMKQKVHFEVIKANNIIIATDAQIAALKTPCLKLQKAMTVADINGKKGMVVTAEEFAEIALFKADLQQANHQDPRIEALTSLEKTLTIFEGSLIRLPPNNIDQCLASLRKNKEYLLITAQEYNLIRSKIKEPNHVIRFANTPNLAGLKKAISYQKWVELPPKVVAPPLPPPSAMAITKKPFETLCARIFTVTIKPAERNVRVFHEAYFKNPSPLERELLEKYETAHREDTISYVLDSKGFAVVIERLKAKRITCQAQLFALEQDLNSYLNDPYKAFRLPGDMLDERLFQLNRNAGQFRQITPEMVMKEVILRNDGTLFAEERPMLKEAHIRVIIDTMHQYNHLQVLEKMAVEATKLITQLKENPKDILAEEALFSILNYEFLYRPELYPEMGHFILNMGQLPRPDQAIRYQWICEGLERNENRLFQTPAGGGKTTWYVPHLILRNKRYARSYVVFSTLAIYQMEKENLAAILERLGEDLGVLEIGMHSELTLEYLKRVLHERKDRLRKREGDFLTPQTFYALYLHYLMASGEKAEILGKILKHFKNHCTQFCDESHRNYDPLTQAVFGVGEHVELPFRHRHLLCELMKPVIGVTALKTKTGQDISTLAQLKESSQTEPQQEEVELIQQALAVYIGKTLLQKFPPKMQEAYLSFWLTKEAELPALPQQFPAEDRTLLLLTRFFLLNLLPKILKMKTGYHHNLSQNLGEIDTPVHYRTPTHAQFKDPYLTFVLSIKGAFARGLTEEQCVKLIEQLKKQDSREMEVFVNGNTPAFLKFREWVPNGNLRNVDIKEATLLQRLKRHPGAIDWYLSTVILPNVSYTSEQLTVSPVHLMNGFKNSILFSATPLDPLAHPTALQATKRDDVFEARVILEATKPGNQTVLLAENVTQFFTRLNQNKGNLRDVRALIDAGGFLSDELNKDVASRWLAASHLDGVLYFREKDEKLELLLKSPQGVDRNKNELLKVLVGASTLVIGTYYDAAHAEATNIIQHPGTKAILFASDSLTLSHAIQSIMRMRGFLKEKMDQKIIWAMTPKLQDKMKLPNKQFDVHALFAWTLKNEAKTRKQGILLAAFQDIAYKLETFAFATNPSPLAVIAKYPNGFREKVNPSEMWGTKTVLEKTEKVLMAYAKALYTRFGFTQSFESQVSLIQGINLVILNVRSKISEFNVDLQKTQTFEMHQKCVVKKEIIKKVTSHDLSLLQPEPLKPAKRIHAADYVSVFQETNTARHIFKIPQLSKELYIEENQLHTMRLNNESLKERYLKRIDFLLVVLHNNKFYVQAISNDVATQMVEDLRKVPANLNVPHKAFIIRADGKGYQMGRGALAPTVDQLRPFNAIMEEILISVALLNGEIRLSEQFKKLLSTWPGFFELWDRINRAHPYHKEYSQNALHSFFSSLKNPMESLILNN